MRISVDDELESRVRRQLFRVMRGFAPVVDDDPGFAMVLGRPYWKFEIDQERLPLAHIVRVVFTYLGAGNLGRGEKLAWEFTFTVDGIPCAIASQKFGLRLYIDRAAFADETDLNAFGQRIVGSIVAGQRVVEREVLRPFGNEQMMLGNITVRNQYGQLRRAYEYFREGAQIAYAGEGRLVKTRPPGGGWWFQPERHEAWWNTFAMVVAYFSLLEHVLVGCLPFAGFDPDSETISAFIGSKWNEKFKRIFDLGSNSQAMTKFNELRSVSETYRNTYGHGGFDKSGTTIAFQVPTVGAIPAVLSDIRDSPHFDFLPTREDDFDTLCRTFDSFEEWLAGGRFKNAWTWIAGGMDYRFDATFRQTLKDAEDDFDSFMEYSVYLADQAANMDW